MALATGAQAAISYVAETVFGTTPAVPAFQQVASGGFTAKPNIEGAASTDLRADRQIDDYRYGFRSTELTLPCTLKHGAQDDILEALLGGTWAANVLKDGVTARSFSFEAEYTDISQYHLYTGVTANTANLRVGTEPDVTIEYGFLGKDVTVAGSSADADGSDAPVAKRAFDSFTGVFQEGGAGINVVTGIDVSVANNMEFAKVAGSKTTPQLFAGRFAVTGTLSAYFEDSTLFSKFLAGTPTSVQMAFTDPDGNTQTWLLPKVFYTGAEAPVQNEQGIVQSLPFQAVYDSVETCSLKITRSV